MNTRKYIGIWMDHSSARLMELSNKGILSNTIHSTLRKHKETDGQEGSEHLMHNKEQHGAADYYKRIIEAIRNYQEIFLFGPTTAKDELFNLLKADRHFESAKIDVTQTDKMSENQLHAFVRNHFQVV